MDPSLEPRRRGGSGIVFSVHYRPDIKLLLVSARWAQRRIQSWQCRLQTAPRSREICKCNLFSIFNIFSIFVFFLDVPEFCPFNSKFQQWWKVTFLCHNFLSHLRFQEYLLTIIERGVCISFSILLHFQLCIASPWNFSQRPACGFNWRWSELSASPLGKLYHWSQTRQQQYFCQLLNYFISLHWLLRGNTSQTLHFQRRVNSKLITLLFNTENFERFLWSVLV